jgi:hypothetical protein
VWLWAWVKYLTLSRSGVRRVMHHG